MAGYGTHNYVADLGFKAVEYETDQGIVRWTADPTAYGGFRKSVDAAPLSSIKITRALSYQHEPWNLNRISHAAVRIADGQVVATHTFYRWLGPWWQVWWQMNIDPQLYAGQCSAGLPDSLLTVVAKGTE
jgi:hypothetical protein